MHTGSHGSVVQCRLLYGCECNGCFCTLRENITHIHTHTNTVRHYEHHLIYFVGIYFVNYVSKRGANLTPPDDRVKYLHQ